eukprot:TRINITY_DN16080_c0_g1_i1.p1 TRINITY_DN16080_c0_g1~~TRINITY_DN16080_c0_g1_i1.p1  ORF type:complete len:120 (-),score=38.02 TRINITY_DN16080_c0_g1_i1:316-675(-)
MALMKSDLKVAAVAALLLLLPAVSASPVGKDCEYKRIDGAAYQGITDFKEVESEEEARSSCNAKSNCQGWHVFPGVDKWFLHQDGLALVENERVQKFTAFQKETCTGTVSEEEMKVDEL